MCRIPSSSRYWKDRGLFFPVFAVLLFLFLNSNSFAAETTPTLEIKSACRKNETWKLKGAWETKTKEVAKWARNLSSGNISPLDGFFYVEELKEDGNLSTFADYLEVRSFLAMGLSEMAFERFETLFTKSSDPKSATIRMAALDCLLEIHRDYSTLLFNDEAQASILSIVNSNSLHTPALQEAAFLVFLSRWRNSAPLNESLALLTGVFESYAKALLALRDKRTPEAIRLLEQIDSSRSLPPLIQLERNELRLILGRLYFNQLQFEKAAAVFEKVDEDSDQWAYSLSDLGWAALRAGNYSKALHASLRLESDRLKGIFSPEALTVAAIALNELCLYPEATYVLKLFKEKYKSSTAWLQKFNAESDEKKESLFSYAVDFLNGKPTGVPELVIGEWVRSPFFISHKKMVDLLIESSKTISDLMLQAGERLENETSKLGSEEEVDTDDKLKRLQKSIEVLGNQLITYEDSIPEKRKLLEADIEKELTSLNHLLDKKLTAAYDNSEFIEVEVMEAASQDLVWRNANPDFDKFRAEGDLTAYYELWQGNPRSLASHSPNRCADKEKYLREKRKRRTP
jgi:hypothetical protein